MVSRYDYPDETTDGWDAMHADIKRALSAEKLILITEVVRDEKILFMVHLPHREKYDDNFNPIPPSLISVRGAPERAAPYRMEWFLQISVRLLVLPQSDQWRTSNVSVRFDPNQNGRIELMFPTVWGAKHFDMVDGKFVIDPTEIVVLHADHGVPAGLFGFDFRLADKIMNETNASML